VKKQPVLIGWRFGLPGDLKQAVNELINQQESSKPLPITAIYQFFLLAI
jgi:hypothetical protein